MASFMHMSSTWPEKGAGHKPVLGTFLLHCDMQLYRERLLEEEVVSDSQQDFPLQPGKSFLPKLWDIFPAFSHVLVAELFWCFT